jgi:DNA polymerase-3 subunit delta
MARLDTDAFFELLDGGGALPPVVCFGGAERVFIDDAIASIRGAVLSGGLADFNHDRTTLRERRVPEVLSLCMTLPVMAPRRLVEVRDADSANDADVDALAAYLDKPAPESVLMLVCSDVDFRAKLPKLLEKHKAAVLCRFDHPKEREMPSLVIRRAKKLRLKLGPGAADALAVTVGADLTLLERALEKLAIAVDGEVTAKDVSAHVADTHLEDAFAFAAAVAGGDRKAAIAAAAQLQAAREEPIRLIGLLAWQLRQVAMARALLDEGKDAAKELRLFGDRATPVMRAARSLSPERHARRLVMLAETDVALKSSRAAPWLLMMNLVQGLTAEPQARPAARPSSRR